MIRVTANADQQSARACRYRLAGQTVAMQTRMSSLEAYFDGYATERFSEILANTEAPAPLSKSNAVLQYSGGAPLAGKQYSIDYWRRGDYAQIDLNGVPACHIDFRKAHIHVLNQEPLDSGLNVELVTGPSLVLLLSTENTYCLHAGAVSTPAGNIGFIAESGVGKSTLTSHVDAQWKQISDDILPVRFDVAANRLQMLPSYPQLKLTNSVVPAGVSNIEPLHFLLRVSPQPSLQIRFKRIPKVAGMLQVVRHTVAAKLFDTDSLMNHSTFAKYVSIAVPIIEVSYPRKLNQLSKLRGEIVNYLENPVLQNSAKASS